MVRLHPPVAAVITGALLLSCACGVSGVGRTTQPSPARLWVLINGDDPSVTRGIGRQVYQLVSSLPGASDATLTVDGLQDQLVIRIDRNVPGRENTNLELVCPALLRAAGESVPARVLESGRMITIAFRYARDNRRVPCAITNMLVSSGGEATVPAGRIAEFMETHVPGNGQVSVSLVIRRRDPEEFFRDARERVEKNVMLPLNSCLEWFIPFRTHEGN